MNRFKSYYSIVFFLILLLIWANPVFCQDPGEPDSVIVECVGFVRPNSQVILNLYTVNDSALVEFQIPLTFPDTVTHLDITCDSISFEGTRSVSATFTSDLTSIDNDKNRLVVFALWATGNLPPGSVEDGPVAKIYFTTGPTWDSTQHVPVDTMMWPPSTDLGFLAPDSEASLYVPAFVQGCIGTGELPPSNDTLNFTAYSPVDLIVTDPNDDSIGIDFNTIPGASYDSTTDVNSDGDKDDRVIIPEPVIGEYSIRVVGEPGSSGGNYTLAVKINGNEDTPLLNSVMSPGPGEVDSAYYTAIQYLRGDPNRDGSKSISDVIYLINYLFKGGEAPEPVYLGDVNCCTESAGGNCDLVDVSISDVIYMINWLFKGGLAPCS